MIRYDRPADLSALQAISEAQKLAFSPIAFQAGVALLRLGILEAVARAGENGAQAIEIAERLRLSAYGVTVLLDMGLSLGLVWQRGERYVLDKVGHFWLNDKMTQINANFVADVCYKAMERLQVSIERQTPCGLEEFGGGATLYPKLTTLPEPARTSWFSFDQFYSDAAFGAALPIVFAAKPRHIMDIGGNTGAWARRCAAFDSRVRVTIVDLPQQTAAAQAALRETPHGGRIELWPADLLEPSVSLPRDADTVWMSQLLDCFAEADIAKILARAHAALPANGSLFVLELLTDRQQYDAAAYSLNATSLYFTCVANGVSRMYRATELLRLLEGAGFEVRAEHDNLGLGHTLLHCVRRN